MKIIITERQYNLVKEQLISTTGPIIPFHTTQQWKALNPHTKNEILGIASYFIPFIGPAISTGIGIYDAKKYYDEGDEQTASIVLLFSMIPGLGSLAREMGLGKWTSKTLGEIGKKISLGQKLKPIEIKVAEQIAKYKELIKKEFETLKKRIPKSNKSKVVSNVVKDFTEGSFEEFKNYIKQKYPMSEDEAKKFLVGYQKETGKNPIMVYNKMKLDLAEGDMVWVATALKYNIKPPVLKYLYHGTSGKSLASIAKNGLDNSMGQVTNQGMLTNNLGKGVTTATGNIDAAKTFSESTASKMGGKPVIVRFPNVNEHPITFFYRHEAVDPKLLEYSYDGGRTWIRSVK